MTEAYVTLVATDAYASGALVLSHKLRSLGSEKEIVCLVTPNVTDRVKEILSNVCLVIPVDTIRSTDFDNLDLLGRPELDITFTKFHVWRLTQYSKIVYLDADTYPLKNIDELFNWPSFSAAPDAGWPDCFNSGVFVTEPSETVFDDLTALASEKGSFDGGDQGLLNSYFSSWSTTPSQRLPFTFNTTPTAQYGYAPAHNQFGHNISVLHFIGQNKPWKYQRFADGRILPLGGSAWEGLRDMVQEWWNTWDEHYGRTPPYHLLSGEFDHQLGFDSGFQTHPIVPFDEPVRNAWEDQKIDFHDERRHIQPMPPLSNISIKHPEWVKEYDIIQVQYFKGGLWHDTVYLIDLCVHRESTNHIIKLRLKVSMLRNIIMITIIMENITTRNTTIITITMIITITITIIMKSNIIITITTMRNITMIIITTIMKNTTKMTIITIIKSIITQRIMEGKMGIMVIVMIVKTTVSIHTITMIVIKGMARRIDMRSTIKIIIVKEAIVGKDITRIIAITTRITDSTKKNLKRRKRHTP